AYQFFAAIGIDSIHNGWQHAEGVRRVTLRGSEAAFYVLEVEAVWLVGGLRHLDQLLLPFRARDMLRALDNQVRLACCNVVTLLTASVPVGMREGINRRTRHEEVLQRAVL